MEQAIRDFANGFLAHPANDELRQSIADGKLKPETYYQHLLRLIYRLLFLLVIEERDLVFPPSASNQQRDIYRRYYSLERLRLLSEKRHLADKRHHDLWLAMLATFRLFEAHGPGDKLGLAPLAGDLFSPAAIGPLASATLGNDVLLGCLRALGLYQHPDNGQTIRVNYAALNVEEFGSVYEGLLEYEPVFLNFSPRSQAGKGLRERSDAAHLTVRGELVEPPAPNVGLRDKAANPTYENLETPSLPPFQGEGWGGDGVKTNDQSADVGLRDKAANPTYTNSPRPLAGEGPGERVGRIEFAFAQGDQRAATGSHYTPDDLVQPLIKHSLDYLIADALKKPDPEKALLDLRVADISCGSGHILLAAARRIATELAIVRTGEEQPSPSAFRSAIRDVIRNCIYGVDLNPLAVELCKVALWLEAHSPGEPLNFLDHHIKCGNAIVGFTSREEAERGVPDEAFATMPGDDKETAALLRKRNKQERKDHEAGQLPLSPSLQKQLDDILRGWRDLATLPEHTPDEIEAKKARYLAFSQSPDAWFLNQIAAIPIAQFYLPKAADNLQTFITDATYRRYWKGEMSPQGQATAEAWAMAERKRFFHWFLEFPEIIGRGGFDCILGNPPYLGGKRLSTSYGHEFCNYILWEYAPAHLSDLVTFFVRRVFSLLKSDGFLALITTNSITDTRVREDSIGWIGRNGGSVNSAQRARRWPGHANLFVSTFTIRRGKWNGLCSLDGAPVNQISEFLDADVVLGEPAKLHQSKGWVVGGSNPLGSGFYIQKNVADLLLTEDKSLADVVRPVLNGREVNNLPDLMPVRRIVNFRTMSLEQARKYPKALSIVEERVKPGRDAVDPSTAINKKYRDYWWQFGVLVKSLYDKLDCLSYCFVAARTTKYLNFSHISSDIVPVDVYVLTTDRWDVFALFQSSVHEAWARRYSSALKQDLRYSPSECVDTFPFPEGLWQTANPALANLGEHYHEHRRALMRQLWLGLTDIYNLFHTRDLTPAQVAKRVGRVSPPGRNPTSDTTSGYAALTRPTATISTVEEEAEVGYQGILELRRLHRELDLAIRDAYGWHELDLSHDFIEVETLPENDRVRYTISPAARKEVLKRLLAENHRRAAAQALSADAATPAKKKRGKKSASDDANGELFL